MMGGLLASILWFGSLPGPFAVTPNTVPDPAFDARFQPPPVQSKWGPKIVILTGAAMVVAGVVGLSLHSECRTRDAAERCVDPRGGSSLYPTLVVTGLAATITGSFWYRQVD